MNLKRYIQLVALLALPLSILIVGGLEGQYIGTKRPWTGQQTADSLAKKADTTVTNQLQAEIDSTQDSLDTRMPRSGFLKAGANVTISEHGSPPDSATIASSGGGGGSNWNPADSTLSLDLPYYFSRNVVQITGTDDYDDWANGGTGTHADETTDYLTDAQSITGTFPSPYNTSYVYLAKSLDLAHFSDGDTCVMADVIIYSVNITAAYIDSLNPGSIFLLFRDGSSNEAYIYISYTSLSAGWNHIKIQKSAFSGTVDWGAVTQIRLGTGAVAPTGEVVYDFDNIQMVRKDPSAAEPNPYQSEGPDGTWTADWTEEGNGNVWLVEEGEQLSVMAPGNYLSRIQTANTYGDYTLSGQVRLGSAGGTDFISPSATLRMIQTVEGSDLLRVYDSTGAIHDKAFVCAAGDLVNFEIIRKGTAITAIVRKEKTWVANSTFCYSGSQPVILRFSTGQRFLSLGFSGVAFSRMAGLAQRLEGVWQVADTLFFPDPAFKDSVYYWEATGKRGL